MKLTHHITDQIAQMNKDAIATTIYFLIWTTELGGLHIAAPLELKHI